MKYFDTPPTKLKLASGKTFAELDMVRYRLRVQTFANLGPDDLDKLADLLKEWADHLRSTGIKYGPPDPFAGITD